MVVAKEDREYVKKREALIPEAERHAWATAGKRPSPTPGSRGRDVPNPELEAWNAVWNQAFHGKMVELVREEGIAYC